MLPSGAFNTYGQSAVFEGGYGKWGGGWRGGKKFGQNFGGAGANFDGMPGCADAFFVGDQVDELLELAIRGALHVHILLGFRWPFFPRKNLECA